MPFKNPDINKVKRILAVLKAYPDGIWLRRLSRESEIPLSTLHYYLENVLDAFIQNVGARDSHGKFFGVRIIKLKSGILKQLNAGVSVKKLLKTKEILTNSF